MYNFTLVYFLIFPPWFDKGIYYEIIAKKFICIY